MIKQVENVTPKISIGMVVYNGVEHIRHALDSIVGQSYNNIELIVADGGSSDGTLEILREYEKYISVLVSEPDKGIYDAMNKVCSLATGDWLIFVGCDDVLFDSAGRMAKLLIDPKAVYYGDVVFRSSGNIYGGAFSKFRLMEQNICHQSVFYPKKVYLQYTYNLNYRLWADYLYNLTLMGAGIKFVYTAILIADFNDKGASLPGDADFRRDRMKLMINTLGGVYVIGHVFHGYIKSILKILVLYPLWKKYWISYRRGN